MGVYDLDSKISNMVDRRFDIDYTCNQWSEGVPSDLIFEFDLEDEYQYFLECRKEELIS